MSSLQPVRGTHDLLPDQMRQHRLVRETARTVAACYGFAEMATPLFEKSEVFTRTLGETSDIVTKEMYSFAAKEGERITLRPEGTAGIARAFMSNGLAQSVPLKFFYAGPMFRHERPQKGRQRQFHQFGVEFLGVAHPRADAEVIALGAQILTELGVVQDTQLEINTLGDSQSRAAWRNALVDYFSAHRERLSADSLGRLDKNPLRILDSKDLGDRELVAEAPAFDDFLSDDSRTFFAQVTDSLDALGLAWVHNPRLVRGLDYYGHTAFEFTTTALGAQGTVLAGGRYDALIRTMGGTDTPGVGFAAGIERLALLTKKHSPAPRPVVIIPVGAAAEDAAFVLAATLRQGGHCIDLGYSGNMKRRLVRADRQNACAAVILGPDELADHVVTVRDLTTGQQERIGQDQLDRYLRDRF